LVEVGSKAGFHVIGLIKRQLPGSGAFRPTPRRTGPLDSLNQRSNATRVVTDLWRRTFQDRRVKKIG